MILQTEKRQTGILNPSSRCQGTDSAQVARRDLAVAINPYVLSYRQLERMSHPKHDANRKAHGQVRGR
jgi:hypothetical protein